ncbi:MAG: hypothetical protein GOMPHAMPRED_007035 [Gomphillus americanus]|uniref:DDHD domain-containing protein n=1 Tax=Gomphillus americanus TaxID=1940652 RepID=A0A8H3EPI4_9LECA|nr:MAG: hypothetical protein GOMPHAMPRED_007035 [Gomphillus americanus]
MAFQFHTYGPSCHLRRSEEQSQDPGKIPNLRAQFFHYSKQPIDEPLSTTLYTADPIIRPFSAYDNEVLEAKWQTFIKWRAQEKVDKSDREITVANPAPVTIAKATQPQSKTISSKYVSSGSDAESEFVTSPEATPKDDSRELLRELGQRQKSLSKPSPTSLLGTTPESIIRGRASELAKDATSPGRPGSMESRVKDSTATGSVTRSPSRPKMIPRQSTVAEFPKMETVVGLSRLHAVEFPSLQVKPIYWEQSIDVAPVMRATWFYKASMEPVEAPISNLLEKGYQYMKPWTETYRDEVASCLAFGPDAEKHLVYHLVPEMDNDDTHSRSDHDSIKIDREYRARGFLKKTPRAELIQQHSMFGVIYADDRLAQILRPNQLPSTSRGRQPLRDIVKHKQVGTIVVRGFDHRTWDKRHPLKQVYPPTQYRRRIAQPQVLASTSRNTRIVCHACEAERDDPNVTDLILVVHGIGQKLSERVESFAFTHSITTLRRDINELLLSSEMQPILRDDLGSIMCLPVNWRATLKDEPAKEAAEDEEEGFFTLEDVTVPHMLETRAFINDVFVDIPYYMSNKHDDMVSAVVREANRIYGAWCKNNSTFHGIGRVHIVGHSLGSVITMDILSKQPTKLTDEMSSFDIKESVFNFDTKNVFFLGSPLGFFFHLHHSKLRPRNGRLKEGAAMPNNAQLGEDEGLFGCPAVDNVYNLIHPQDPVSYRLNPCVDTKYAANLKQAIIPTLNIGWFGRRAQPLVRPTPSQVDSSVRPSMRNLPSNVEMEVHDFTKEEKAENQMYLLNDNGQIDWLLPLPGSFGIPYLSILYAHSSYWTSKDLVRFLVIEIGRASGRDQALPILKAKKKLER